MAWASAISGRTLAGNKRVHWGTWTSTGATTGGDIDTGLAMCESIMLTHIGSAVEAAVAVINDTLPVAGTEVTVVCTAADTGYWLAVGY